jgi:fructose-1,6-bisphosphatase I
MQTTTVIERKMMTLERFIAEEERGFAHATGEFSQILRDVVLAAKVIHREINRAGLTDVLGAAGGVNVHAESVQKLDVYANELFKQSLETGGLVAAMVSEEDDRPTIVNPKGKYIVVFDPLDGSSNIDVNVPVGSIFAIYRKHNDVLSSEDYLRCGREQLAAGYVLYGTSTILVYTTGAGVNGFTLDTSIGEFVLSHPEIKMPSVSTYYSFNDAELARFPSRLQAYVHDLRSRVAAGETSAKPRYVGSLVADFHRNLLKGGIFMYPGTTKKPEGKLRLLYECAPMAMIAEQAGGVATDGTQRLLEVRADDAHRRVPFFVGSPDEMTILARFLSS